MLEYTKLKELIDRFNNKTITDDELKILKETIRDSSDDELLKVIQDLPSNHETVLQNFDKEKNLNVILNRIDHQNKTEQKKSRIKKLAYRISYAASILAILTGSYLIYQKHSQQEEILNHEVAILPGEAKAQILLEDGSMINLENIKNDTIISLNGYSIKKDLNGELSYLINDNKSETTNLIYNTIITPRGGEYKLNLSDGTTIWVNSSSTIKYPLDFSESRRDVYLLQGEAFFEVTKKLMSNKNIPFFVHTSNQIVEVLGTSFNINSYTNEIKTTLVEGKVKLNFPNERSNILSPNQQSIYNPETKFVEIKTVDPFYTVAWKDGTFTFDNTPIKEVMETIARWYDIEIMYNKEFKQLKFTGTISKSEQIQKVLNTIELTGTIKFEINGRRIFVM